MKSKFLCILIIQLVLCQGVFAQNNSQFSKERRVYLWDVTLSMKGYKNKTPDIWDKVVKSLCENINSVMDESTEIIILPYQERILERWVYKATKQNKEILIRKIQNYNNDKVTNTNIYTPFKDVVDSYLKEQDNVRNVIFLLTDGQHNVHNPSVQDFYDYIRNWCTIATSKNAYAFYITLTEFARDKVLSEVIANTCNIKEIPYTDTINFVELSAAKFVKYNIKEDKNKLVTLKLNLPTDVANIPKDIKIRVRSNNNSYVTVDETCIMKNNEILFTVKHLMDDHSMKELLPSNRNTEVSLSLSIDPESQRKYPLVLLTSDKTELELVNKPEKTLKINIK